MRECARSVACTVTRASTARLIKSTPQCGRVLSVRQSAPQRTLRTGFSPTLVRRNGVCVLSPYDCSVLSFYGCAPFPALAKVRSYTLRITRLHGRGRAPLFDKISAAAFFLARRSPNENGRFPAAENLPRGKPIVTTASAVRSKQFTSVRGAQGIPHTVCGPAFRECFRLFLSRRPSRHRYAQPMSASRRADR